MTATTEPPAGGATPPAPGTLATQVNQKKKPDPGSAEVRIDQKLRCQVKDPFKASNFESLEQLHRTAVDYSTALTRAVAAKVEMDPLIAQKLEVGKCVHAAFVQNGSGGQMPEVTAHIKPWMSYLACAVFTFLFAYLIPIVLLEWDLFPTLCLIVIGLCWSLAGWEPIKKKHMGVCKIFGKRYRIFADEGNQWSIWLLTGYLQIDMSEKDVPNENIVVIAGNAEDAGNTIPPNIADSIDTRFGPDSGLDVLDVITKEVVPTNLEILRAREAKEIERAKSDAEDEDARRRTTRTKDMITELQSVRASDALRTEALRTVAAQEDQMDRQEIIVSGASKADSLIAGIIAAAQAIKSGQSGGHGGGKRRDRRNWKDKKHGGGGHQQGNPQEKQGDKP